ncbi:uncharacterized protein LOC115361320 isoform X2 [Myripristis murdjan]|uniref:uncharacterized protein LOC115361320 isoform X2 n=1 Tax=Myripristis murdjan TaxID=586833 RepID=UPI001176426A|nr:uncharacterized protein LOC115361320 isoform X2 [Myripristis murdjan]
MAAGLQLPSMFLVCLLSLQASDSSAFPRVSSSGYTETRQGLSKKPQEGYGFGNRRHQARSDGTTDWSQSYTQPSQHRQELAPHHFPQRSPTLSSHPWPKPRGFAFNIKVPLAKTPNKKHVTGGGTKDTDLASGFQSTYRPTSVQIHSSFNKLPSSAGSSPKGSASDLNGAQSTHDTSKPHFQLSFSVPIPPSSTSKKPSSGKGLVLPKINMDQTVLAGFRAATWSKNKEEVVLPRADFPLALVFMCMKENRGPKFPQITHHQLNLSVSKSVMDFPNQHIEGQKGQSVSPDPLIVGDSPPHYPDVPSAYHQTQMQLPTHYTGKEPFDGKHPFTKLVIEAEPEMNNFHHSPQPDGQHTEFGRLVPSTYLSHQLESHLFGYSSNSGDHEDGQYENYPQKQADTEQTWYSYPMPEQTNLASYTGTYASSVPTYFDQTQQGKTSEPTFKPMPDYFGTSQYGQYPNSYLQEEQHASNYGQTIENLYGYNPLFQQGPSSFNPAEGLTVGHRAPANAPQITKYPSSVAQSSTQEPAFELNIAVPIDISSSKNTDTPPPQSHSHFLASSTELHQHNTSRNGDFIPISHPGNATLQASQYTLPTKPLSPQPQQQSQSVSEVHPPHSAHSSSSNSYPFQFGSPISLKPFVSDYSVVPPSGQHFQQAAGTTKPLQSLQPSYQDSTSHSGGFAQVTSPLNPGTQTSHSPASIGGGYSYGGGFAFGSLQSGHMPSSHSIPVGGEHSLTHQYTHHGHGTVDSGGYKPSSGPKQSMAQDVFNHGYKPSTW